MATTPRTKPRASRVHAREAMPAYGVADGVQSWRYNLKARERAVVDRALALLGGILREPDGVFTSPDAAKDYLSLQLGADPCERFSVLYLNCQHRTIAYECHFSGTLTQTSVYPREIVTAALKHQASAVVLAHNHPSGSVEPSNADVALTQSMKHALALVDVRVLDHIIVGRRADFSFIENGLL